MLEGDKGHSSASHNACPSPAVSELSRLEAGNLPTENRRRLCFRRALAPLVLRMVAQYAVVAHRNLLYGGFRRNFGSFRQFRQTLNRRQVPFTAAAADRKSTRLNSS